MIDRIAVTLAASLDAAGRSDAAERAVPLAQDAFYRDFEASGMDTGHPRASRSGPRREAGGPASGRHRHDARGRCRLRALSGRARSDAARVARSREGVGELNRKGVTERSRIFATTSPAFWVTTSAQPPEKLDRRGVFLPLLVTSGLMVLVTLCGLTARGLGYAKPALKPLLILVNLMLACAGIQLTWRESQKIPRVAAPATAIAQAKAISQPAGPPSATGVAPVRERPIGMDVTRNHLRIAASWYPAVRVAGAAAPGSGEIDLVAHVHATEGNPNGFAKGEWLPYLSIKYTLKAENGEPITGTFRPLLAAEGPRCMTRLKAPGTSKVRLTLHLTPPSPDLVGRLDDPASGCRSVVGALRRDLRRRVPIGQVVAQAGKAVMLRPLPFGHARRPHPESAAMIRRLACLVVSILLLSTPVLMADGPADNVATSVRRIPKAGVKIAGEVREELEGKLAEYRAAIEKVAANSTPKTRDAVLDLEVVYKAVHDALKYDEFFDVNEIAKARKLLALGLRWAGTPVAPTAPRWPLENGLYVSGYRSRIDSSVQPFGLVIPEGPAPANGYRLDVWCHGRGETLSELNFIDERLTRVGEFNPPGTIVLHPYGRYCNANKFAGEIDVLEAIDAVKSPTTSIPTASPIRGFSMGGARPGNSPCTIPTSGSPPIPAQGSPKRRASLMCFNAKPCNRRGTRRSSGIFTTAPTSPRNLGMSDCRLQRRTRQPEASRRRDGRSS